MSRIEMAMEKAARLRQAGEGQGQAPETPEETVRQVRPAGQASHVPPVPPEPVVAPKNPFLVNLLDPHSATAEEYRKLKSQLVKLTHTADHFKNLIMVTSSVPCEGKSLTALNLAISLAQELDHTVLLIDADLRRPSLHRYLDIEQGPGLADVLTGEAEVADTLVATGIGKLSIMRAGRQVANPVELFSSQRMQGLMDEMKHRYPDRYIIFDTSPVLPFAESRTLAGRVDGIVFVVMERLASQANVVDALESLKGCHLLGLVYNAVSVLPNDERYSYHYYDRYQKDQPEKQKSASL